MSEGSAGSRYNRILDEVKKSDKVKKLKKDHPISIEFSDGEYSVSAIWKQVAIDFTKWLDLHNHLKTKKFDELNTITKKFHFWFSQIYNKNDRYNYSSYLNIVQAVNTSGHSIDKLSKDKFKLMKVDKTNNDKNKKQNENIIFTQTTPSAEKETKKEEDKKDNNIGLYKRDYPLSN